MLMRSSTTMARHIWIWDEEIPEKGMPVHARIRSFSFWRTRAASGGSASFSLGTGGYIDNSLAREQGHVQASKLGVRVEMLSRLHGGLLFMGVRPGFRPSESPRVPGPFAMSAPGRAQRIDREIACRPVVVSPTAWPDLANHWPDPGSP